MLLTLKVDEHEKPDLGEKVVNSNLRILSLGVWGTVRHTYPGDSYFRTENKFLNKVVELIDYIAVEVISVCIERRKLTNLASWVTLKVKGKCHWKRSSRGNRTEKK